MQLKGIHHIAIIASDYQASKMFYTEILGMEIVKETYRQERQSFKLDLSINGRYQVELFSFPESLPRPSFPEARGLRHLAFAVDDLDAAVQHLKQKKVDVQEIRVDEITNKRFVFFKDPDGLPLELYETAC